MAKKKTIWRPSKKPKVKKVVLNPAEIMAVKAPPGHLPLVIPIPEDRRVDIVPIKKKKGWWATLLYGNDE
jgi:hypothetical protein